MLSESLRKINFSYNLLENSCGDVISNIISKQNSIKGSKTWKSSLRSTEVLPLNSGITEIILSYNEINDKAIETISCSLHHDTFIRALDISNNKITSEGFKEIMNLLEVNTTILYINIKESQLPLNVSLMYSIIEKLCFNLEGYKNSLWQNNDNEWQDKIADMMDYFDKLPDNYKYSEIKIDIKKNPKNKGANEKEIKLRKGLGSQHPELQHIASNKILQGCQNCVKFERELFQSRSQCIDLQLQNNNLTRKLQKIKS